MTPLERENRDLRRANERLEEQLQDARAELDNLRGDMGLLAANEHAAQLKIAIPKLQPRDAWLLAMLYGANGKIVHRDRLRLFMPTNDPDEGATPSLVNVRLWHIRKAIGRECIWNSFKIGWGLTPAGMAKVEAALSGKCA